MTVVQAVAEIETVINSVAGLIPEPDYPKEAANDKPFFVVHVLSGEIDLGPVGTRKYLLQIAIDVMTTVKADVTADEDLLLPFVDTVPAAILAEMDDGGAQFNNKIDTLAAVTVDEQDVITHDGVMMMGYRFIMVDVKILI